MQSQPCFKPHTSPAQCVDDPHFLDSHCHWDCVVDAFDKKGIPFSSVLNTQAVPLLAGMVVPGIEPKQWPTMVQRLKTLQGAMNRPFRLGFALGWHPWFLPDSTATPVSLEDCKNALASAFAPFEQEPLWVAMGETGLDAMRPMPMPLQLLWLEAHLQLADALQKPVILHCVKAHHLLIPLLKRYSPRIRGVIHAFSGSYELGQSYQRMGFYLGIGGTCTYPRAQKTHRAITQLPLECLLLETDAPWMPLNGDQGQPNHPYRVVEVAAQVAELKQIPITEVAKTTYHNALGLFFA